MSYYEPEVISNTNTYYDPELRLRSAQTETFRQPLIPNYMQNICSLHSVETNKFNIFNKSFDQFNTFDDSQTETAANILKFNSTH